MSLIFLIFLLVPSIAIAYVILATFYGVTRAYLALCWIPLTIFGIIYLFQQTLIFQHSPSPWPDTAFLAVGWTSLIQTVFGVLLATRAYHRQRDIMSLLLATALVLVPFFFRS